MTASLSQRRSTLRAGVAASERSIDAELARQRTEADAAQRAARQEAADRRALQGGFTADDLAEAGAVQTAYHGWLRVLKVNRRTVDVDCIGDLRLATDKVIGAACWWPRRTGAEVAA